MRATQARVGMAVVLGLLGLAVSVVPTIDRASGELIPPLNVTWEAADPTAGLGDVVAWHQGVHDGQVRAYLEAVEAARIAQEAADARRAKDAQARASRGTRVRTGDVWGALAACESGGNPTSRSASGRYTGAFQFADATWQSLGYSGSAADHPYATQLAGAQRLQARSGWGQWPRCSRKLGLR